jgi:hypothetical protein
VANVQFKIKSGDTIRARLHTQLIDCRQDLINELKVNCDTISLSFDGWTSKNNLPIFAIIGHWITPEYRYRDQVLEFTELQR